MFLTLTPDIVLYTLSYLTLPDVLKLYTLSHDTHDFLVDHESAVFHQLAVLHRFVTPGTTLEDAVADEHTVGGLLDGVTTWKELCMSAKFTCYMSGKLIRP